MVITRRTVVSWPRISSTLSNRSSLTKSTSAWPSLAMKAISFGARRQLMPCTTPRALAIPNCSS